MTGWFYKKYEIRYIKNKIIMKHIVTGGAGFIGSNLVDELINQGDEVIVIDDLSTGFMKNINPKASFVRYDIKFIGSERNRINQNIDLEDLFSGVDTVFHLAASARVQPSIDNPISFHENNVLATLKLLKLCSLVGVRRFVFSSSSSVYGEVKEDSLPTSEETATNPLSPYALNKLLGEEYCKIFSRIYNLETVCLRYFNVFGERQPLEGAYALVMGTFANQKLQGKPLTINGDGEQRRDFTYVKDIAKANILASKSQKVGSGECINIGNGSNISVNDIADMIGGEKNHNPPVIEPRLTLANNSKAKKLLDWRPSVEMKDWIEDYKKEMNL